VSSIEPDADGGAVDGGEEVAGSFIVTRGNSPELLEFCEEVLDQVTRFIKVAVVVALNKTVLPGGDNYRFPRRLQG